MTATQPGRNDRCPCGSGKKYKHCCLHKEQDTDVARRRLRTAEGHVVDGALALAAERWGNDLLLDAWDDFWNGHAPRRHRRHTRVRADVPAVVRLQLRARPVRGYSGRRDDADDAIEADEPSDWPDQPLALEWLATQRPVGDALDRRYAETACRSPLSVFVVEQAVPGQSLDVRDVLTGARFHVLEAGASRTLRAADLLFASVLTIDDVSVMFGASHYVVPPDWHTRIIDWREHVRKRTWTRQDLEDYGIEIRGPLLPDPRSPAQSDAAPVGEHRRRPRRVDHPQVLVNRAGGRGVRALAAAGDHRR